MSDLSLKDLIPKYGNKPRWEVIDDAIFTLVISGILTDSEARKAKERLLKMGLKQGLRFKTEAMHQP